jgi:aryl-alcohol dehydrogenase-like predicted oxidoreductase
VAREHNLIPPTMEQPQYNMLHRDRVEKEYHRLYDEIGLGTTIWSPLASGLLTGKYNDGVPEDSRFNLDGYGFLKDGIAGEEGKKRLDVVRQLGTVAGDIGSSLPQMALAWCLKNPNVSTVITGASNESQVKSNMGALDVVPKLTDEVMERIAVILETGPQL